MSIEYAALSDCGKTRVLNEDSFLVGNEDKPKIFILADGMGGHNAGEIASKMMADTAMDFLRENSDDASEGIRSYGRLLAASIAHANTVLFSAQAEKAELCGMGTTSDICAVWDEEFCVAHVGDSRVYILKGEKIKQITKDHSVVEMMVDNGTITQQEAKTHPQRNIITRAVGTSERIKTDISHQKWSEGDVIIMCSDGLTNMLSDAAIADIVRSAPTLGEAAANLVREANSAGGFDNITVILIKRQVRG
ncbi:MAG: Stp1/IreP family PP2C-type Ser/Thr phosphatase [Clostridia bacterium]|nr:Stp1/IreP family PP2C-type Ser/Thr phosphatase [Clostridia bacterium]